MKVSKFPEILGGRVKTLHPKIFGGILGPSKPIHVKEMKASVRKVSIVVVNLYPFEQVLKKLIT